MASMEDAAAGLETIILQDLPSQLAAVQATLGDGLVLDPILNVQWEESDGAIANTPAVLIIGSREADVTLRDVIRTCTFDLVFVLTDSDKKNLTKKMYRYARAFRMTLRLVPIVGQPNRTLRGKVISAKVVDVDYGPTFTNGQLFMRDFRVNVEVRVVQEND